MPNGYPEHKARIWAKSRFWGVVWQVGDACYYLGLVVGSIFLPILLLAQSVRSFDGWPGLLRSWGLATCFLLTGLPVGILTRAILQAIAERCAGIAQASDQ